MPTEVLATPRADQQIAGLDRTHARAFGEFLDDLAARGCQALGYRLSGPAPVDHLCVKHLRDSLRVVVAFEGQQRAWILLVGRHDDQDPVLNVYAELYRLLGVEPPDSAGRDKPPCCDENTDLPPVLGAAVTELVDRAAKVRRTRRQPASLPVGGTAVEQGYGQKLALFVTCRRLALQSREVIGHKGTVVSRSVTGLCKLDVPYLPSIWRRVVVGETVGRAHKIGFLLLAGTVSIWSRWLIGGDAWALALADLITLGRVAAVRA